MEPLASGCGQRLRGRDWIFAQVFARTALIVLLMSALLGIFIFLAASQADILAIQRQRSLIATVLSQKISGIAHDQESATVWDDAVMKVRSRPLDTAWMDSNMGVWLHTFYGHDDIFVLDGSDRPIYAARAGLRVAASQYLRLAQPATQPLINSLRKRLSAGLVVRRTGAVLTPAAADLAIVGGRPAIISVKPIVSDSGRIDQQPGREYLHISLRYLDGTFASELAQLYRLDAAHFARALPGGGMTAVPLKTASGESIGYFVWDPFRPGRAMLARVAPAVAGALALVFVIVLLLLRRISRSTHELTIATLEAERLALRDPLTGLANRTLFEERLSAALAKALLDRQPVALLYIDLDHFKNVNDSLGHPTGDALICALSVLLTELSGARDTVARLGGDEFAIITLGDRAAAEALCQEIQQRLSRPIHLGVGQVVIGASIGIAVAPADAIDKVELVRKADIALYDAKTTGRRKHSFFIKSMGDRIAYRHDVETDLRIAMRNGDGLDVFYQPYFAAQSGELQGAEALIRWHHPMRGTIGPEDFIPVAEECGLIETLSEWVIEKACSSAAGWNLPTLAINLSSVQLRNAALAERIYAILKRTRLDPLRLELELTETSLIECNDRCRNNLGWLRDTGVTLALDDFGTGYSSFKHLSLFDIDRVKIDRSFIAAIDTSKGGSPLIQAIVDLARSSHLATTAEGVETEQQRQFLSAIGCSTLQGFLLGSPVSADALEARFALRALPTAPADL